jgi:DNA polymerase
MMAPSPVAAEQVNAVSAAIPVLPRLAVTSEAAVNSRTVTSAPTAAATVTLPGNAEELHPTDRAAAMADLRERAIVCRKCPHLVVSRKNVVFGVGNIEAELMFVGEAPGADEDLAGEPFVGAAGQLLTRIIQTMGFSREQVYIANVLKCRPDTPGQQYGNRKPTADEIKTCLPYLMAQINLIRPRVMVALGGTAMEGLFGQACFITKARGRFAELRGIPVMPTYHPSYLLRNQALAEKRKVWEDMLQVLERLERPITDKQRGFFLKASS